MLTALSIRDVVLVDALDLEVEGGLTVLTGETGAGKSIILDALGLALGGRGDAGLVRSGAKQAVATAVFTAPDDPDLIGLIAERGFEVEAGGELILRRVLSADGRSRAFVNDQATSVGVLRELGGLLIEGGGEHAGPVRAVIGIGVNVAMPHDAGAAIDQPWTDLRRLGVAAPLRNALAAGVISRLLPALDAFGREGLAPFLPRYRTFDALRDMPVEIHDGARITRGTALGIAADGALRVHTAAGERELHAGEVSLRRRAHG